MLGVIEFDDGAGGVLSGGVLTSTTIDTNQLNTDHIDVNGNAYFSKIETDLLAVDTSLTANSRVISATELSYLDGVTNFIQTQINDISDAFNAILGTANVWTNLNTYQYASEWVNTVSGWPFTYTSTSRGAIYGSADETHALTFLNTNTNNTGSIAAFVWDKMTTGSSITRLMMLNNNGDMTLTGQLFSPTIDAIDNDLNTLDADVIALQGDVATLQTDVANKQDLLTSTNRLDASYIAAGVVSNAEYNYLEGVTSSIQTQINGKATAYSSSNRLDAAFIGDGLPEITNGEFSCLGGVTGVIQSQLNNKQPLLDATTRLNAAYIGGGNVSSTEYNYLNGVTSAIQTQLNNINDTISGDINCTSVSCTGQIIYRALRGDVYYCPNSNVVFTWDNLPAYIILSSPQNAHYVALPDPSLPYHDGTSTTICNLYDYDMNIVVVNGNPTHKMYYDGATHVNFYFSEAYASKKLVAINGYWTVL